MQTAQGTQHKLHHPGQLPKKQLKVRTGRRALRGGRTAPAGSQSCQTARPRCCSRWAVGNNYDSIGWLGRAAERVLRAAKQLIGNAAAGMGRWEEKGSVNTHQAERGASREGAVVAKHRSRRVHGQLACMHQLATDHTQCTAQHSTAQHSTCSRRSRWPARSCRPGLRWWRGPAGRAPHNRFYQCKQLLPAEAAAPLKLVMCGGSALREAAAAREGAAAAIKRRSSANQKQQQRQPTAVKCKHTLDACAAPHLALAGARCAADQLGVNVHARHVVHDAANLRLGVGERVAVYKSAGRWCTQRY